MRGFSFFDPFDFDRKKTLTRSLSHIDLSLQLWGISLRTASIAFAITLAIWVTLGSNSVALCADVGAAACPESSSDCIAAGTVLSVKGHESAVQLIEAFQLVHSLSEGSASASPLVGSSFSALSFIQGEGTVMLYVHGASAADQITEALVEIKGRKPCGVEVMESGWASFKVAPNTGDLLYSLLEGSASASSSNTVIADLEELSGNSSISSDSLHYLYPNTTREGVSPVPEVAGAPEWGFFLLTSSLILLGASAFKDILEILF